MRLERLEIENFRSIDRLVLDVGRRLTLLVGNNGAGKTSVLDAMATGFGAALTYLPEVAGRSLSKKDIRQKDNRIAPYVRIAMSTVSGVKWDRILRRDQMRSTALEVPKPIGVRELERTLEQDVVLPLDEGKDVELPVIAYYGVSRALLEVPLRRRGFPRQYSRFEALSGALQADSRFKSAFMWFYNKENEEHRLQKDRKSFEVTLPELDAVREAISRMIPDVSEPHIALNPLRFAVRRGADALDIMQLSDGYKTLLGLVIDLSVRMAQANPHRANPLDAEAVVLIDEIDLHLHPSWQQHVVGDLLRTFTNTQFVLTTHSPFIVESINNLMKRHRVTSLPMDEEIERLFPLDPADCRSYLMTESDGALSMLDEERGLCQDHFLDYFNELSQTYDAMRDLEWEHRQ
ncbi:DUF2813 domain-containing protein [Chlorobium phaeovibrioides]|uniref:DUF2813 domain-containing protein n=1 Tax=Chlorobium phaeovibrioides TaxID=1094 RepID=A0A432ATQ5_CHLPH|nr:AAA family ATPase [Chlorobium phaeovibrioides]RTY35995.1 DUF2813 domain-containing protein [Chlorobium phaeovibrioides]